jgi:hypothetical protein
MIAVAEQDLVVEPSEGLTPASVAPSHYGAAGGIRADGQFLDRDDPTTTGSGTG